MGQGMSGKQKFQIVSAGKVLRARKPAEVLAEMSEAFSISSEQARKLLLKGWVIKDELSPGQVVQYRTRLQQIGLKIEVHPAGTFDNRALLSRMQYAKKRRDRKIASAQVSGSDVATATPPAVSSQEPQVPLTPQEQRAPKQPLPVHQAAAKKSNLKPVPLPAVQTPETEKGGGRARQQLDSLFVRAEKFGPGSSAGDVLGQITGIALAGLVPLMFAGLAALCIYQGAIALWKIPAAVISGEFGPTTLLGSGISLLLLMLFAVLFIWPYYRSGRVLSQWSSTAVSVKQSDAPGLFLLLQVLQRKTGLPQPEKLEVTSGADVSCYSGSLRGQMRGEVTLSLGLAAARSLGGGEVLALIVRSLSFHHGKLRSLASWLVLEPGRRLEEMQDALENEQSPLSSREPGETKGLLHTFLASCGLALVPVVERLHAFQRLTSRRLAAQLQRHGDTWAASITGSDGFALFAEHWQQLVHADLVTGEINREAQLLDKRLRDYPAAVHWLFENLDAETRSGIEAAMGENSDLWNPLEPACYERVDQVQQLGLPSALQRKDFTMAGLFADFSALAAGLSKLGIADRCRAIDNHLLMAASEETEQARQVLAEFFNRAVPRDLLPLAGPVNEEWRALDLQGTIDWLRSRLVDLQDLEQRRNILLLQSAKIQLGAALIRQNPKQASGGLDIRKYHLSGLTLAAVDESRRDNRARLEECQQQRSRILAMFYQRIEKSLEGLDAAGQNRARALYRQLKAFASLEQPLSALEGYGDLVSEMVEQLTADRIAPELVQKYMTLAAGQVAKLQEAVEKQGEVLGGELQERLAAFSGAEPMQASEHLRENVNLLQALELRCKNIGAVVLDCYHRTLAGLLQIVLEEERRLKVRPLRLAALG